MLWGEPIGLMPIGEGLHNIYFADRKLVGFDSRQGKLVPLTNPRWPKDKNKNLPNKEKASEMCPVYFVELLPGRSRARRLDPDPLR